MEDISTRIKQVLPHISSDLLSDVSQHLQDEMGVEEIADLQYVQAGDLPMLKTIQARKLIESWKKGTTQSEVVQAWETERQDSAPVQDPAVVEKAAHHLTPLVTSNFSPLWAEEYTVPYSELPSSMRSYIEQGLRPKPSARREFIRLIASDIASRHRKPGTKALTCIAMKIVAKYPDSFKDVFEGQVIGTGYDSLLRQLQVRFENVNRKSCKPEASGSGVSEPGPSKKVKLTDQYGCVEYMPTDYPSGENEVLQKEKKKMLQDKHTKADAEGVEHLMEMTYRSQRTDIVQENLSITDLLVRWPYLLEVIGMMTHFKKLTNITLQDKICASLSSKGIHILKWLELDTNKTKRKLHEELLQAKVKLGNNTPEVIAMILAVMLQFDEKEEFLYISLEPTATRTQCENKLPKTPCLIGLGDSKLIADRFLLGIDGKIVNDHIPAFSVGLAMLFASYYNFGIQYPREAEATLEFIQRCIVGINPEKGSKKVGVRSPKPSAKVLTMINILGDLQWRS